MYNPRKILITLVICFWACQNQKNNVEEDSKVVILIDSEHNKWLQNYNGFYSWSPSKQELDLLEDILDLAISNGDFNFLKKPQKENIENFYRQYIPYLNKKGERIIEINAFCEVLEIPPDTKNESGEWVKMDWRNEYVMVEDGGPCYWQITINIDKKTYYDLIVNGVA